MKLHLPLNVRKALFSTLLLASLPFRLEAVTNEMADEYFNGFRMDSADWVNHGTSTVTADVSSYAGYNCILLFEHTLTNYGTLKLIEGAKGIQIGLENNKGFVINEGRIETTGSIWSGSGKIINRGYFYAGSWFGYSGSYLINEQNGTILIDSGRGIDWRASILNEGIIKITGVSQSETGFDTSCDTSFHNTGDIFITGENRMSYGMTVGGRAYASGGYFDNDGTITIRTAELGMQILRTTTNRGTFKISDTEVGLSTGSSSFANAGLIDIQDSTVGIDLDGHMSNSGTVNIESSNIGIRMSSSWGYCFTNSGTLSISATQYGLTSSLINNGIVDIAMEGGDDAFGIYLGFGTVQEHTKLHATNMGVLKTDRIKISRDLRLNLMHDSTTGAHTDGKAMEIVVASGDNGDVYLGGSYVDENTVAAVEGGSRVNISSGLTLAWPDTGQNVRLGLQDDVILSMGGDLNLGSYYREWNDHALAIDNGDAVRNVTLGANTPSIFADKLNFTAAWNHALVLAESGVSTSGKFEGLTPADTLVMKSGTLDVAVNEYFAPKNITLEGGRLNLQAAAGVLVDINNATFNWASQNGETATLAITPYSSDSQVSLDINSTKLNIASLEASGQKIFDLAASGSALAQMRFSENQTCYAWSSVYDTANGLYNYYGYQKWADNNSSASSFETSSGTGVVIYNNDLYYCQQASQQLALLKGSEKNWRGGNFVVYDAEKNSKNNSDNELLQYDNSYCALAVGLNMAEYWLDQYAVLNTSARNLPYASSGNLNSSGLYTLYSLAWTHDGNNYSHKVLGWILSGNAASASMLDFHGGAAPFASNAWSPVSGSIAGQKNFEAQQGKIYQFGSANGVISDASASITQIITQAFEKSDAPVSIGWHTVRSGTTGAGEGNSANHVVTCWGYETSVVNGQTVVSKLWYTDSDDKTLSQGTSSLRSYDVIYAEDQRAYLVDTSSGASMRQFPTYITDITFFTTPEGFDDMLKDYYGSQKPIYWTGVSDEWKADKIQTGEASLSRLATISDGWRKQCEGAGKSIWAYTTFSGTGDDVVFGEAVNGVKVENREITLASDMNAGKVTIAGKGYEWKTDGGARTVEMSSLLLNEGSLVIGKNITVNPTDAVAVQRGFALTNHGQINADVVLAAGGSLTSGSVSVGSGGETAYAVADGLYIQPGRTKLGLKQLSLSNVNLHGDSYTLGTTVDFGGLSISRSLYDQIRNGKIASLNDYVAHEMFRVDSSELTFNHALDNYQLSDDVWSFLGGLFRVDGGDVSVSGSAEQAMTLGSVGAQGETSVAEIQFAEQYAGTFRAAEANLETVAGESTYVNDTSIVESQHLHVVAGSTLENDGVLQASVEVDGTLKGAGQFGDVMANSGGRVVIGGSPGVAKYESLTLKSGADIVFSIDGMTPAAEGVSGWGSGSHSLLSFTGAGLTAEAGAEVKVALSSSFLTSVETGKSLTFTLITGVVPGDELLSILQGGTSFCYATLDDTLSSLTESTLYSVRDYDWMAGADNNSIMLSFILGYADGDAVIWTNAAQDGGWNTASVNWRNGDGVADAFATGKVCRFTDEAAGTVTMEEALEPSLVEVDSDADYLFTGSGSLAAGALMKSGSGTLRVETENTYDEGTTLKEGKLEVGHVSALGTGDVAVLGGTLDVQGLAIQNRVSVSGTASLVQAGNLASLTLYSGSTTQTDAAGIMVGTNQSLTVTPLVVLGDAGNATLSGPLTLCGGTLYFEGTTLTVTGGTVIDGSTTTTIDLSSWAGLGSVPSTLLAELGTLSGTGSVENLTLAGVDMSLYPGAELVLTAEGALSLVIPEEELTPEPAPTPEPEAGVDMVVQLGSRNRARAYAALRAAEQEGAATGELAAVLTAMGNAADTAALQQLMDDVSGEEYATMMASQVEGNLAHLRRLRANMGHAWQLNEHEHGLMVHADAFSELAEVDADASGRGFRRSEWGAEVGLVKKMGEGSGLGVALSQGRASITPTSGMRYHEDSQMVDAYHVFSAGPWENRVSFGVGFHEHDLCRSLRNGRRAQARGVNGTSFNLMEELAYHIPVSESVTLRPFAAVESSFNRIDGFTEEGLGMLSLSAARQEAWATELTLGMSCETSFSLLSQAPRAGFSAHAGVTASVGDTTDDLRLHFSGAPGKGFEQSSADRNRWGLSLGAGLSVPVSRVTTLYATAEAVLRGDSSSVDAQVGVRMNF